MPETVDNWHVAISLKETYIALLQCSICFFVEIIKPVLKL
jgi:hypothetical protein